MIDQAQVVVQREIERKMAPGGMLLFNVDDGYLEGILRGYRSGFLSTSDFVALTQCETLEDVRMHLTVSMRDEPFTCMRILWRMREVEMKI